MLRAFNEIFSVKMLRAACPVEIDKMDHGCAAPEVCEGFLPPDPVEGAAGLRLTNPDFVGV